MRSWYAGALLLLVAGCGGSSTPSLDGPQPSPTPTGAVPTSRLEAMLLQSSDLPGLSQRRAFADAGLTTQSTPQLSLCHEPATVGPHELANVVATSAKPGGVKVFEVVSVFGDEAAAQAAFERHVDDARACGRFTAAGIGHRVVGLASLRLGAGIEAVQYGDVTSDVLSGDVRTYARRGMTTVLITGFGAPPGGGSLLSYQVGLMRAALARLG
ncbi:MAG: hypothetical protein QOJ79_1464 [Actinomycetota bacterium]|jgi:hypothetical protein|nr:hypothetical protein [Actinomycetota bacterium]